MPKDTRFIEVFGLSAPKAQQQPQSQSLVIESGGGGSTSSAMAVGQEREWQRFGRESLLELRLTAFDDKVKDRRRAKRMKTLAASASHVGDDDDDKEEADFELWLKLAECDFVYSPQLVRALGQAFETPHDAAEAATINAIYEQTVEQATAAARDAQEQMARAWSTRKNWQVACR